MPETEKHLWLKLSLDIFSLKYLNLMKYKAREGITQGGLAPDIYKWQLCDVLVPSE